MATGWQTFPVRLTGGLVTNLGVLEQGIQKPGSAIELVNFEPSIEGGYSKLKGYNKFSSSAIGGSGSLVGVIPLEVNDTLAYKGGTIYRSTGTTWSSVGSGTLTTSTSISFDYFNFDGTDKVVIVDGVNKPIIYNVDTATATEDTSAPSDVQGATVVAMFKNHIFFLKGSNLYFTEPFDELGYDTGLGAGVINLGSEAVGMVVFREQLILFSTDKIQRLVGNTALDFRLEPISEKTGCLCRKSIQIVGGDVIYLGPDGIRRLGATERFGDFALARVSENIQSEILAMVDQDCNYPSTVIRTKNQYRIFRYKADVSSSNLGYLATQFVDQSSDGFQWAKLDGIPVRDVSSKMFREDEVIVFTKSSDNDYVYVMDVGDDFDGTAIRSVYQTPYMPITDPQVRKTIYKHTMFLDVNGVTSLEGQVIYDYNRTGLIQPVPFSMVDNNAGIAIYGAAIYGTATFGAVPTSIFKNQVTGSGFTVSLRYVDNSSNPSFTLNTFILDFKEHDRK